MAARIEEAGGQAAWARTDVKRRADLANLVRVARERFGKLDVLVSNAGVGLISPLDELRVEDWEEMIDVNFKGVLYGIAAALPVFREQGHGHFVNTASAGGADHQPHDVGVRRHRTPSAPSPRGCDRRPETVLRVTVVSPGFVRTNFADSMIPELRERIVEQMEQMGLALCSGPRRRIRHRAARQCRRGDIVVRPTAQA